MYMNDAALPGNIREYVFYSAYYVVSAIRSDADNFIAEVPYIKQVGCDLILIFARSETIENSPLQVLCAI